MVGKLAKSVIENYIKELSATDMQRWLAWAKRMDGPLFWEIPSPEGCPISPKADGYQVNHLHLTESIASLIFYHQRPIGRMNSQFITDVAKTALSHAEGTVTNFGCRPVGLFTLIVVAVSIP
jgi:hypothetical protein